MSHLDQYHLLYILDECRQTQALFFILHSVGLIGLTLKYLFFILFGTRSCANYLSVKLRRVDPLYSEFLLNVKIWQICNMRWVESSLLELISLIIYFPSIISYNVSVLRAYFRRNYISKVLQILYVHPIQSLQLVCPFLRIRKIFQEFQIIRIFLRLIVRVFAIRD